MNSLKLLVTLLVCHYLADFCLTLPIMIRAKANGKQLWPIALHSMVHALLMGLCLLLFGVSVLTTLYLMAAEAASHFIIDLSKARLSSRIPRLADATGKPYWMLYGLDQLLHQLVVVGIWAFAVQ
jgi:hypothetical protein